MFGADKGTADKLDGKKLHIGIVQARFNEGITNALAAACRSALIDLGVQEKHIDPCASCPAHWKCRWRCRPWPSKTSSMR